MEGRCLDPGGQRLGVGGRGSTGCWGSTEAPRLAVLNFSATGGTSPLSSSCKSLAMDNTGLGGLAMGQAQPLLAPNPSGSAGLPWASRGLSRPSTWGWGPHLRGGLARVLPTSQPPGQSLRPLSSSCPFPGRCQESLWGSGPSGPASCQEAVCRRAQHCPRLCAHPQMCSCGSALTPPVLGAPGQRHPTARMEKSGLAGAGRASTLLSGVGVAGRRFHFPAGSLPIFHI